MQLTAQRQRNTTSGEEQFLISQSSLPCDACHTTLVLTSRTDMQVRKGVPQGLTPKPRESKPSVPSVPKAPSPKLFAAKAKEAVRPAQKVTLQPACSLSEYLHKSVLLEAGC